jgi:hypothetical protein
MELRLCNGCDSLDNSYSDLGGNYELPNGVEKESQEAVEYLTGVESFTLDEIEVF